MSFVIGIVFGAGLLLLVLWLRMRGIAVRWYEWLMGALGLLLLIWAVHDFFGSLAESNEYAAQTLLWVLGVPALILLGLVFFLVWRRQRRKAGAAPA